MHQLFHSPTATVEPADIERDFAQWIDEQAELLRVRDFERLDLIHLVEEIEAMGENLKRELGSRLEVLMLHLLKCEFQPARKSSSWTETIDEQRSQIIRLLKQSPSLKRPFDEYAHDAYRTAVNRASRTTGLAKSMFPKDLPYTREQLLDGDFVP